MPKTVELGAIWDDVHLFNKVSRRCSRLTSQTLLQHPNEKNRKPLSVCDAKVKPSSRSSKWPKLRASEYLEKLEGQPAQVLIYLLKRSLQEWQMLKKDAINNQDIAKFLKNPKPQVHPKGESTELHDCFWGGHFATLGYTDEYLMNGTLGCCGCTDLKMMVEVV